MALRGQQRRTFLTYERAILPEDLRLGSLYLNPLEPVDGLESMRFEYREDLKKQADYDVHISDFTRREEIDDKSPSFKFQRSHMRSADISFSSLLGLGGNRESSVTVTLSGTSGRRVKIKRPEAFLQEVFNQEGVEEWIRRHASLSYKSKHGRNQWKAPELWLVTGVQYLTGGEYHFEDNTSSKLSAHGGADLGAAAGGPPGVLKVKGEIRRERGNGAQNGFGHEDERVWAAQFMPVKIDFGAQAPDPKLSNGKTWFPSTIKTIYLQDVEDLQFQGVRATQERAEEEPPKLVARIRTGAEKDPDQDTNDKAENDDTDDEGLVIDDGPYVQALQDANWEMYDKYTRYMTLHNGKA